MDAPRPYSNSLRPRLGILPPPVRSKNTLQEADNSEKLRLSTANATHMLEIEASRRALAASAEYLEHSDDDSSCGATPPPVVSPHASVTSTESQTALVFSKQGGRGGVGGEGASDDASTRELAAAARRRSLASKLARYAGDLKPSALAQGGISLLLRRAKEVLYA